MDTKKINITHKITTKITLYKKKEFDIGNGLAINMKKRSRN